MMRFRYLARKQPCDCVACIDVVIPGRNCIETIIHGVCRDHSTGQKSEVPHEHLFDDKCYQKRELHEAHFGPQDVAIDIPDGVMIIRRLDAHYRKDGLIVWLLPYIDEPLDEFYLRMQTRAEGEGLKVVKEF